MEASNLLYLNLLARHFAPINDVDGDGEIDFVELERTRQDWDLDRDGKVSITSWVWIDSSS